MTKPKQLATDYVTRQDVSLASDVERYLDDLEDRLNALDRSLKEAQKVSASSFIIDQDGDAGSPAPTDAKSLGIKVEDMESIRSNNRIIMELMDVMTALDTTESKLRQAFPEEGSAKGPLADVTRLRKATEKKLGEAYAYLQNLSKGHAPAAFTNFVEQVNRIVEKSIIYLNSTSHIFLHEVQGSPAFSHYLQLDDCIDEDGTPFPKIFVVTSMHVVKPAAFYVTVLQDFEAPSGKLFLKQVAKAKEVVRFLHHLLLMDSFANSLGAMPLPLLLKPNELRMSMFNAAAHIKEFEVDESTGNLIFHLKPSVQEEDLIQKISSQLQLDVKSLLQTTRSKLRVAKKDWGDHFALTFFMLKPDSSPQATADDLQFMKERLNLDETKIKRVLHIINSSTQYLKGPRVPSIAGVDAAKETDGKGSEQEPNQPPQQVTKTDPTDPDKAATPKEMQEKSREEEATDGRTPDTTEMSNKDIEFFAKGGHKPGSKERKLLGAMIEEHTNDILYQLKKAAIEWNTAGSAVAKVARKQPVDARAKQSLRVLSADIVRVIETLALKEDFPHGLLAMLAHVGPHEVYTSLVACAVKSYVHDENGTDVQEDEGDMARFDSQMTVILTDTLKVLAEALSLNDIEADEWAAAIGTSEHHAHYDGDVQDAAEEVEDEVDEAAEKETAAIRKSPQQKKALDAYKFAQRELDRYEGSVFVNTHGLRQHEERVEKARQECIRVGLTQEHGFYGEKASVQNAAGAKKADLFNQGLPNPVLKGLLVTRPNMRELAPALLKSMEAGQRAKVKSLSEEYKSLAPNNAASSADKKRQQDRMEGIFDELASVFESAMFTSKGGAKKAWGASAAGYLLTLADWAAYHASTANASAEQARVKGDDEYTWFAYTGKPLSLSFRGTPVTLRPKDKFGVRYSSNKKDKRLVLDAPGFGLTKVFTLTPELEARLRKNIAPVKASTNIEARLARLKARRSGAAVTAGLSDVALKRV